MCFHCWYIRICMIYFTLLSCQIRLNDRMLFSLTCSVKNAYLCTMTNHGDRVQQRSGIRVNYVTVTTTPRRVIITPQLIHFPGAMILVEEASVTIVRITQVYTWHL